MLKNVGFLWILHSTVCRINSLSFCSSQNVLYTPSMCQVRAKEWLWDVITCWQEPSEYRHVKEVWNLVKAVNIRVLAGWLVLLDKNGPVTSAAVTQNCHLCTSYLKWSKSKAKYVNDSSRYCNCMCFWHTVTLTGDFCPFHLNIWLYLFCYFFNFMIYCHYHVWNKRTECVLSDWCVAAKWS